MLPKPLAHSRRVGRILPAHAVFDDDDAITAGSRGLFTGARHPPRVQPEMIGMMVEDYPAPVANGITSIILATTDRLFSRDLNALIMQRRELKIIGTAYSRTDVISMSSRVHPRVAILDEGILEPSCYSAVSTLHCADTHLKIIVLGSDDYHGHLIHCIDSGAMGYLSRSVPPTRLLSSIRAVLQDHYAITPDLAAHALKASHSPLTDRERDVLRLISLGADTTKMADSLCLSVGSIRNLVSSIFKKTGRKSRAGALAVAHARDWL